MQAQNLDILLADIKTRTFSADQSLASFQQKESNSLFSMLFDQTLQMNQNMDESLFNPSVQYNAMPYAGSDYMGAFQKDLMTTGIPMERISMSSNAKTDLQEIMTGQGYTQSDVDNFLDNVFQEGGPDTIKVSDFMKMYAEKKPALEKTQTATPTIEASDLPVVEKGLKEFGLTANQVKVAIENSRTESGDVDIKQLVQELASIDIPLKIDRPLSEGTQSAMNQIFSKLGIEVSDKSAPLTFNQFVSVLKGVSLTSETGNLSQKRVSDLIASLMTNVRQTTSRQDILNIRQLYQSQLYQLNGLELDIKDRPSLENALRNMGLTPDEIQKVMAKVLNSTDKISLANLVDTLKAINPKLSENLTAEKLFNRTQLEKAIMQLNQNTNLSEKMGMDISKDLQNVLKSLGVSDDAIKDIIAKSSLPSGKINVNLLIDNLKQLASQKTVLPKVTISDSDLQSIQLLLDRLKSSDQINVSELLKSLDNSDLKKQLQSILTQLGVPKEQIQNLLTKAQNVQDGLSVQQLMAHISNILDKAGVKTDDQTVKSGLQTLETLLSQIQLTNQTISQADLADLKNMLKQFGANQEMLNKVFPPESEKSLTLAQFAANLKRVTPQLNQTQKVMIPQDSNLKNILASLTTKTQTQDTPKTLDAFIQQLAKIPTNQKGKLVSIQSSYINDLKAVLKDLGFQSAKINEMIPKNAGEISVESLLAKMRPAIAESKLPNDQLKNGFAKLNRLLTLIQTSEKNSTANQGAINNQKAVADMLSKMIGKVSGQDALINPKQAPILEQTLISYGLTQKDAQKLISQSKNDKGDILLSKLSEALQTLSSNKGDSVQIKTLADHMEAYLALLDKQATNKNLDKRGKNIKQQLYQNMKDGKAFDTKDAQSQKSGKLAEVGQQARMAKMVTRTQGNSTETLSAASQADDNNAFISFLKQESTSAQSAKLQSTPKPPERPVPYFLNQQVGRQLANAIRNNDSQLRIQLKPPQLGTLQLDLEVQNNVLKVGMATDNQVTRDLLVSHVNDLKDALAEQGIKVDEVDIQINYDLGQSLAKDQGEVKDRNRFSQSGNKEDNPEDSDEALQAEVRRPIIYGDSSLSLIV